MWKGRKKSDIILFHWALISWIFKGFYMGGYMLIEDLYDIIVRIFLFMYVPWSYLPRILTQHLSTSLKTQKIRDENNFSFIITIIPNMMAGLRHIWTMSSYFCNDENMLVLLSKISNIFTIKVMSFIDLEKIFRYLFKFHHFLLCHSVSSLIKSFTFSPEIFGL